MFESYRLPAEIVRVRSPGIARNSVTDGAGVGATTVCAQAKLEDMTLYKKLETAIWQAPVSGSQL